MSVDLFSLRETLSTSSLVGAMPPPPPLMRAVFVVIGASGDLAKRKTFPALFALLKHGFLCPESILLGFSRSKMDDADFSEHITSLINDGVSRFKSMCHYVSGDYNSKKSYALLKDRILELKSGSRFSEAHEFPFIFYLAIPPSVFLEVARSIHHYIIPHLSSPSVPSNSSRFRLVVEKPFGHDLDSSNELSTSLAELFDEKQITFKETQGVEGRGGYFDSYGIIRDVMQNHLLQILSLIAMARFVSKIILYHIKVAILRAIRPIDAQSVVLGQYVRSGSAIGYTEDPSVPDTSTTATFAALVIYIDVPAWRGVPFILRCGKGLNEQKAEIRIQFKEVDEQVPRNELVIRVQPREAVYLKLNIKNPGLTVPISYSGATSSSAGSSPSLRDEETIVAPPDPFISSELDLTYGHKFSDSRIPDAYESLLLDLLHGEQGNFVRRDELDAAWKIFTPLLENVESRPYPPVPYAFGSRGPKEADDLIKSTGYKRDEGYTWHPPRL
ncbi:glucose-6-phosphate 1-dehydrogenase [Mitosporidium daphniae]|uniref:Glucose-6-phosphate 1-dehydrogenase n=1 Tax=Mitosporidium daphniae TaxID=1485682 RepID=A0A098VQ66_9MICR|nr:glucose-6-phosphate 1-dehydrogenase [Mitosporidium daphniae]KGG51135.1 glucose-6-phosphate 1-dehydrogenase [Mitosporidium daphniae]|eukprot:XP_013237562.1 glucose-6-phosphate 1-dehydrogenase [Mitosporidium daphniae]